MSGGTMGDQNAPERIWTYGDRFTVLSQPGRERPGYVRDDLYQRAITERDEARQLADASQRALIDENAYAKRKASEADRYREALTEVEEILSGKRAAKAGVMQRSATRCNLAIDVINAALAEGEQPAGECSTCEGSRVFGMIPGVGVKACPDCAAGEQSTTETGHRLFCDLVTGGVNNPKPCSCDQPPASTRRSGPPAWLKTETSPVEKGCPDGGTCNHGCSVTCWRSTSGCPPLSSFGDTWPSTRPVDLPAAPATPEGEAASDGGI